MARTVSQQLEDVDAAIAAIENGGQSYATVLGQQYARANIRDLYNRRNELQGLVDLAAINGDGGPSRIQISLGSVDCPR